MNYFTDQKIFPSFIECDIEYIYTYTTKFLHIYIIQFLS